MRITQRPFIAQRIEHLEQRCLLAADDFEPNDSFATPIDLGTGDQTHEELSIHEANNDDWYKWTASADGSLSVELLFQQSQGDLDLTLYDAQENELVASFTTTDNEQLTFDVVADQNYFIQVVGFRGATQDNYTLVINGPGLPADALEANNTAASATILSSADQDIPGLTIHEPGDVDWYRWRSSASGVLNVDVSFVHAQGDVNVEVRAADESILAAATTTTDDEHISINVVAGTAYLIRVFGQGPNIQRDYALAINGPEPAADSLESNDTFQQATDLRAGDQQRDNLSIHASGNDDWFRWTAATMATSRSTSSFCTTWATWESKSETPLRRCWPRPTRPTTTS